MTLRKPAVMIAGVLGNLPSTDTLDAPQAGGDVIAQVNDEVGAVVCGTPVYNDVADGVKKAKADASGTVQVVGLMRDVTTASAGTGQVQQNGTMTLTTAQWDAAFGTTGGLTVRTRYYLSAGTAGLGTATAPTTTGQYVVLLGIAISTTELNITLGVPYLL